ncbi:MBL fold metallo-hydrolase [Alloalcanivorax gelatiniphagus]|uniref:MBL fold metallo-hydrolase n=1 Tax=Alloalcanivorax gelatiniphagus TaxID=1194167 RepID=A0ABY2XP07_9GAMM|nr:MBL fold metallo-hydrolase [Alloalcanivorax gelatiniphagus]
MGPDASLLIDCGLFQGEDAAPRGGPDQLAIGFDVGRIKALVVTHVHIDHVGRIPWLLAAGFDGPILCSEPSARLLPLVLEDAFKLSLSRQTEAVERYLKVIEQRLVALPYDRWHRVRGEARIRLRRAGHILGSAYVECDLAGHRTVFSGDLGAPHAPLLDPPEPPEGCDTLVIESTYGDRQHQGRARRRERLAAVLRRALRDQGTVLIPAFSIGRTQELLYELEDIIEEGGDGEVVDGLPWRQLPVILDSPLASRFTRVYRELAHFWPAEARARRAVGRRPLAFEQRLTVDDHDAHRRMVRHLAESRRPAVVIAASGMCTGGRIVNYLKAMLGDPRHNVLFVGYQAAGTPGRDIQTHGPKGGYVDLDDERITIRAGIETLGGYSAHADRDGLIQFVTGQRRWPSRILIVHGDPDAKQALADALRQRYREAGRAVSVECPPCDPA